MEGLSNKLSLQLGLNWSQSERSSKKFRFRHDVKKRIKERCERKTANTCDNSDIIHDNVQPKILCSYTNTEDEAMSENYKISKCSHLAAIIKRLWAVSSVGSNKTSEKMYSPGHAPCYLRRNLKGVDKKKRLGHKTTTPKRRKRPRKIVAQWGKKELKSSVKTPEFYFRFRTSNSIHRDARCNNTDTDPQYAYSVLPKTIEIGFSESGQSLDSVQEQVTTGTQEVFKISFVEDSTKKQWHRVPLFSKRPRQWKSLVRENDDGPD